MKLFQISPDGNIGSVGTIAEGLGCQALSNGWESKIAYSRFPANSKSGLYKIGSQLDFYWHALMTRLFDRHGLHSYVSTQRLLKVVRDCSPSVIQLHHLHGYYINLPLLFDFLSAVNTPVVWTFHDCWAFTGHCAHFEMVGCDKWHSHCGQCPQSHEYPASWLFDRSYQNFETKRKLFRSLPNLTIVTPSNWLSDLVRQSFFSGTEVCTIHNGINLQIFMPSKDSSQVRRKYGLTEKFVLLGVASPWSKGKGLNDFIELSRLLPKEMVIALVGLKDGQKQGLPANILPLSRTESRDELVQLYSAADVFVNPTWEDNFPTTNLESLACGTPIITYNTGGSHEAIDGDTGFVVDKGGIKEILSCAEAIKKKGKSFYSKQCRARAESHFEMKSQFQKYVDLYKGLVK